MQRPFSGMNRYLEEYWGDVHHRLIVYASDAIQKQLPNDLRARPAERSFVESEGVEQDEPIEQGFIEIIDIKSGRRVVTVIEILSPSNKIPGLGRELYLKKQEELRNGRISLVEIDLVREGSRWLEAAFETVSDEPRTPYAACVLRGWKPLELEYYRLPLRERLPAIAVPLRETDHDVTLDLQTLIDRCYDEARYDDDIDYREDPDPPLDPDHAQWADALLREHGRR
jgi:hypothetical protein